MILPVQILLIISGIIAVISFLTTFVWSIYLYIERNGDRELISTITDNPKFGYSSGITIISFIFVFSLASVKAKIYRDDVNKSFSYFDNSKDLLYIDNLLVKNDSLIRVLKNIDKVSYSRNTGETKINITIMKDSRIMYLMLLRDFSNSKKYWVHLKESKFDDGLCIGEINTSLFDTIKPAANSRHD